MPFRDDEHEVVPVQRTQVIDDELLGLKRKLDEVIDLRDNLKLTQERCNVLLNEVRQLKHEKARLCSIIEKLLGFVAEEANEETVAFITKKVKAM